MEFLLGNPFGTPVGQRIEKATDGSLRAEDWALNMEICDIINETEDGPKDALRALKKRIVGNKNFQEVMLALTALETCVKNCGHRFHVLVASQEFVEGVLVKTILPKNNPPTIVHDKVLNLIQAWADAFRSSPDLTGVVAVYEDLRRKGLEFPMTDLDTLSPIHTPQASCSRPEPTALPSSNTVQRGASVRGSAPPPYVAPPTAAVAPADSPVAPTPEQVAKLRSELEVVNGNVKVMSEMLTEISPQTAMQSDVELLQELNRTCRAMQQRVLELISRITHEQLTEELLIVNDNLNNVFLRHERFERMFAGQQGTATVQSQVPRERIPSSSLIDLAAPSSAVQPLPPTYSSLSAPSSSPEQVQNLSTQLAGIDTGSGSVSGTLQSLESNKKPDDEFDMFALTRGSSLAEQRKSVKYEDPQARDGLAGALDTRQQNTGAIPATQSNFMEDIEKWLSVDGGDEVEGDDGVTSEEFDKFLEERAKAADRIPSLPSPPTNAPQAVSSTVRNKKNKEEDSLFAL
ncbi:target of Myb 1 isoform X2 [Pelobates cultripes]|uniref:Target of Myb 1 isoform X2 n=1 Tax=Pelobates cultripes TaxID=61616 RepID=A0AAD1WIC5_PELCU|nr:target of Myb 1 isoform X2 [Pelobates cultripes]CAH2312310.1 target of Myb 1 isoform X2 [Pelobates cultripes]CAH2312311.1 target of Myb 1 isoform X2 [Pelobates cultripes]